MCPSVRPDVSVSEIEAQEVGVVGALFVRPLIGVDLRRLGYHRKPSMSPSPDRAAGDTDFTTYLCIRKSKLHELLNLVLAIKWKWRRHEHMFAFLSDAFRLATSPISAATGNIAASGAMAKLDKAPVSKTGDSRFES